MAKLPALRLHTAGQAMVLIAYISIGILLGTHYTVETPSLKWSASFALMYIFMVAFDGTPLKTTARRWDYIALTRIGILGTLFPVARAAIAHGAPPQLAALTGAAVLCAFPVALFTALLRFDKMHAARELTSVVMHAVIVFAALPYMVA